jgi:hypothetical protein
MMNVSFDETAHARIKRDIAVFGAIRVAKQVVNDV